jgi:hypothetical protein
MDTINDIHHAKNSIRKLLLVTLAWLPAVNGPFAGIGVGIGLP